MSLLPAHPVSPQLLYSVSQQAMEATVDTISNPPLNRKIPEASESYPEVGFLRDDLNLSKEPPPPSSWISTEYMKQMLDDAATEEQCTSYFKDCPSYDSDSQCWNLVPTYPVQREVDLYNPFVGVIQSILEFFQLGGVRTARDSHKDLIQYEEPHDDDDDPDNLWNPYSCVDLMVLGSPAELDYSDPATKPWISRCDRPYAKCLTPIEVKRKSSKESEESMFSEAVTYARYVNLCML